MLLTLKTLTFVVAVELRSEHHESKIILPSEWSKILWQR